MVRIGVYDIDFVDAALLTPLGVISRVALFRPIYLEVSEDLVSLARKITARVD